MNFRGGEEERAYLGKEMCQKPVECWDIGGEWTCRQAEEGFLCSDQSEGLLRLETSASVRDTPVTRLAVVVSIECEHNVLRSSESAADTIPKHPAIKRYVVLCEIDYSTKQSTNHSSESRNEAYEPKCRLVHLGPLSKATNTFSRIENTPNVLTP